MPHGTRAFFYRYSMASFSLGTDLNDQSLGDSLYVPAVWDGLLMSGAPRGVQ